ncbi:MAG: DNA ligase [Thiovulaceae bacterium]|nr:DNA ligase [Sulfurimonadaceae bacterium]
MKLFLPIFIFLLTLSASQLPPLQHARTYSDQNISGWVMSEKLDGIRGYWDGENIYTKHGKRLFVPLGFTKNFPPFALDGELWSRRSDFEAIQSKVLQHHGSWEGISYNIFEVPYAEGPFLARIDKAREWFLNHPNPAVRIIPQYSCRGSAHLERFLDEVVAEGGEGVMVKNPDLPYISGRTSAILKVKRVQDMEGRVVAVNLHKQSGTMRSLVLELANGIRFSLGNGFTDHQRENPLPPGTLITFRYYGFTKYGKPKFASFMRIREE